MHALGLAGDHTLHGYHCDCPSCESLTLPWRGQSDSTCSGELISTIFESAGEYPLGEYLRESDFIDAAHALSAAAVDVDAEPGMNAGFHVHVAAEHLGADDCGNLVYEFVRWEPTLRQLAGGRWPEQRTGMNVALRRAPYVRQTFADYTGYYPENATFENIEDRLRSYSDTDLDTFKQRLYRNHRNEDRHSNLCVVTRHDTFEFRLWNSTRAAWRMEMFTRVSLALMDPAVIDLLGAATPGLGDLAEVLDTTDHGRAAELVQRQAEYLANRAGTAPSALTLV